MPLTEDTVVDQITVTDTGAILVREATTIARDGTPIPGVKAYHRTSYEPGTLLDPAPAIVKAIAGLVWTPDVIKAAEARREAVAASLVPPPAPEGEQP
jgi:hypothetical protein